MPSTGGRTVLVVDDDPGVLELLELALAAEGYLVVSARNGREGLAQATASHPRVMLVDLMMPIMDGREFVLECRKHDDICRTPVIILSAAQTARDTVRDLAVQAIVPKPFDLGALLELVASYAR